jgi:hypothetical protein
VTGGDHLLAGNLPLVLFVAAEAVEGSGRSPLVQRHIAIEGLPKIEQALEEYFGRV